MAAVLPYIWFLLPFLSAGGLIYMADGQIPLAKDTLPPFGRLFSPFHGFWQNSVSEDVPQESALKMKGLQGSVTIRFDDRLVPHIFADNDRDLYFAQGFMHAKFRLWQMDLQTRAAGGRLAEILGPKFIQYDLFKRRSGMMEAARKSIAKFEKDSLSNSVLNAYTDGINAYINDLSPNEVPFEYKLLDFRPEPWSPVKTALMLKYMCWDLTNTDTDLPMTNVANKFGYTVAEDLFPNYAAFQDPIAPKENKWDFKRLPLPKAPAKMVLDTMNQTGGLAYVDEFLGFSTRPTPDIGSNNWVIGGDKTKSGYPILADDPHLNLTLPSIWYEMQLCSPSGNVYGVSLPGAPAIVIGYNEQIAWGVTNVGADVMDWYKIQFRDEHKKSYFHNKEWKPVSTVLEEIKVRYGNDLIDTTIYTHHGPVVFPDRKNPVPAYYPVGCALKWIAHEPSNELATLLALNRANSYNDYTDALKHWVCPAQNFCYADTRKNIALWSNGKYPLKWRGQGKYILDGTDPAADWQGFIPQEQNPYTKNPDRGFVSSGNQFPADTSYPYYLDWDFEAWERGARINQRLSAMQNATWDSLRSIQNDNFNLLGQKTTPKLLSLINVAALKPEVKQTFEAAQKWDYYNNPESVGATVFHLWWLYLEKSIWSDEFGAPGLMFPNRARTALMILTDSAARWYDNSQTPEKETLAQNALNALQQAHDSLMRYNKNRNTWQWGIHKGTNIKHLARVNGLGTAKLMIGGGRGIVNAAKEGNGPSWRMVVAMTPYQVRGYGVYPGGQSGHPGSKYYDNMVHTWEHGELIPLVFLKDAKADDRRIIANLTLTKE